MNDEPKSIVIDGHEARTSIGSSVWVGMHETTACIEFTSPDGTKTQLGLTVEGSYALIRLLKRALPEESSKGIALIKSLSAEIIEMVQKDGAWKHVVPPKAGVPD